MASAAVLRGLFQPGVLTEDLGTICDRLFHDRQQCDSIEFVSFDAEDLRAPSASFGILLAPLRRSRQRLAERLGAFE